MNLYDHRSRTSFVNGSFGGACSSFALIGGCLERKYHGMVGQIAILQELKYHCLCDVHLFELMSIVHKIVESFAKLCQLSMIVWFGFIELGSSDVASFASSQRCLASLAHSISWSSASGVDIVMLESTIETYATKQWQGGDAQHQDDGAGTQSHGTEHGQYDQLAPKHCATNKLALQRLVWLETILAAKDAQLRVMVTEEFDVAQLVATTIAKVCLTPNALHVITTIAALNVDLD